MLKDLKPVLWILGRFLGIYFGLIFLYQLYFNAYKDVAADPITRIIAQQSNLCLNKVGYKTELIDATNELHFYVNQFWVSIMVEGCNAISIMILFLAFIFAFYQGGKTFWFAGVGLLVLYIINVARIALLNIILLEFPKYSKMSHDYLFPAVIYGGVVLLWVIWIKFFVIKK
ncbi:MAG: exosortase family protein XrtF [Flavobacteriaceae bacterium]|nr:exosortase family protein XrtF [Flavobacteriaceae bacterium]